MGFAENYTRRQFFWTGSAAAGSLLVATGLRADGPAEKGGKETAAKMSEDVSPAEDLMREHGVLRRLLLVYEEVDRRLGDGKPVPSPLLSHAAHLIREFIEDYHERQEEDHVFPRLVKAGKLVSLTKVLQQQHDAGRRLTDRILGQVGEYAAADGQGRPAAPPGSAPVYPHVSPPRRPRGHRVAARFARDHDGQGVRRDGRRVRRPRARALRQGGVRADRRRGGRTGKGVGD